MERISKPSWDNYLNEQVKRIKERPLLGRNDFIRPFRRHDPHFERLPQKDLFKSMWLTVQFSINPVARYIPFADILRKTWN